MGGLEIALHCQLPHDLVEGAAAIALPECFLGLVPGWGGAYLLPNLIGPEKALKVIVDNPLQQNKMLKPKQVTGSWDRSTRCSTPLTSSRCR